MAIKKNFREDFDLVLTVADADGTVIDLAHADFDWTTRFFTTSPRQAYVAGRAGGVLKNCTVDTDGHIHVIFDNHGLQPGALQCEFTAELPDPAYPDGRRRLSLSPAVGVELTMDPSEVAARYPADIHFGIVVPAYIKDFNRFEGALGDLNDFEAAVGESLDSAVSQLEAILKRTQPMVVNRTLCHGIIPLQAQPGRVYRNCGQVRARAATGCSTVIDISPLSELSLKFEKNGLPELYKTFARDEIYVKCYESENEVLVQRFERKTPGGPGIRFIIEEDIKPYIMKDADGKIRLYTAEELGFVPVTDTIPVPDVRRRIFSQKLEFNSLREYLKTLVLPGWRIEVEFLDKYKLYRKKLYDTHHYTHWRKRKRWEEENNYDVKCAIVRIRYATRRRKGAWVPFYFRYGAVFPLK